MTDVVVFDSAAELAGEVASRLGQRLQSVHGRDCNVVLTGGTLAAKIYAEMTPANGPWQQAHYWWGDERFVPAGHLDRNDKMAEDAFLDRLAVPVTNRHPMPAHGCEQSMADAADEYGQSLPAEPFDVVLLGVGPDAHIASLFPQHPQVTETERKCVEVFDSPKPPPQRITLTYPALNHSAAVWLVVSGAEKASAVAAAPGGASALDAPAAGATGMAETIWFLDRAAASQLSELRK